MLPVLCRGLALSIWGQPAGLDEKKSFGLILQIQLHLALRLRYWIDYFKEKKVLKELEKRAIGLVDRALLTLPLETSEEQVKPAQLVDRERQPLCLLIQ
jgi:hypothetical protein